VGAVTELIIATILVAAGFVWYMRHTAKTREVDDNAEVAYWRAMNGIFEEAFLRNPEAWRGTLRYERWEREQSARKSFDETLANVRETLDRIRNRCVGCDELVSEGPRAYAKTVDVDEHRKCLKCRRERA
jgi:hypothetical protein